MVPTIRNTKAVNSLPLQRSKRFNHRYFGVSATRTQ
jgi:hypothetical protein